MSYRHPTFIMCPFCNKNVELRLFFHPSEASQAPIKGWFVKEHICVKGLKGFHDVDEFYED